MSEARLHGTLVSWHDARHFGFLRPDRADKDVFVGEAAFRAADIVPVFDERYSFATELDERGRRRATDIRYADAATAAERVFTKHEPVRP